MLWKVPGLALNIYFIGLERNSTLCVYAAETWHWANCPPDCAQPVLVKSTSSPSFSTVSDNWCWHSSFSLESWMVDWAVVVNHRQAFMKGMPPSLLICLGRWLFTLILWSVLNITVLTNSSGLLFIYTTNLSKELELYSYQRKTGWRLANLSELLKKLVETTSPWNLVRAVYVLLTLRLCQSVVTAYQRHLSLNMSRGGFDLSLPPEHIQKAVPVWTVEFSYSFLPMSFL